MCKPSSGVNSTRMESLPIKPSSGVRSTSVEPLSCYAHQVSHPGDIIHEDKHGSSTPQKLEDLLELRITLTWEESERGHTDVGGV